MAGPARCVRPQRGGGAGEGLRVVTRSGVELELGARADATAERRIPRGPRGRDRAAANGEDRGDAFGGGGDGEGCPLGAHRRHVDSSADAGGWPVRAFAIHLLSPFRDRRHVAGGSPVLLRNARTNADALWNPASNPASKVDTDPSRSSFSARSARRSAKARIGVRPSAARKRRAKWDGLTATAPATSFA